MTRAYYIDRLRVLLTMLVIFHHSAIAFGASGGWYYVSSQTATGVPQMILSLFMAIDQAFFMSFFFFISALLMPASFERKGFGTFLKDRLIRLGIPLVVYTLLINPVLIYGIHKYLGRETGSFLNFLWIIDTRHPGPGPMWFVLTLLIFETVYGLIRRFTSGAKPERSEKPLPSAIQIGLFILGTGIMAFVMRLFYPVGKNFFGLQFGYFVLYMAMYVLGIVANRNNWVERFTLRQARPWFIVSLVAIPVVAIALSLSNSPEAMSNFSGGLNLQALTYALWEPVICVGFCFFLLMYFRVNLNKSNEFVQKLSSDSYTAYIIHPLIVVGFTFLAEQVVMPPLARLAFVLVLGIPSCFLAARLIRRIPGMKRVL